jgi:hypothetical protein
MFSIFDSKLFKLTILKKKAFEKIHQRRCLDIIIIISNADTMVIASKPGRADDSSLLLAAGAAEIEICEDELTVSSE